MRLVPRSLLGQLALLILGAFLAAQAISIWLFADERGAAILAAQRFETVERAEAVARALETAPTESRESILAAVNSRLVRFSLGDAPLVETGHTEFAALEGASDIRATEITVSPHDGRPAEPPAAFALAARADARGGRRAGGVQDIDPACRRRLAQRPSPVPEAEHPGATRAHGRYAPFFGALDGGALVGARTDHQAAPAARRCRGRVRPRCARPGDAEARPARGARPVRRAGGACMRALPA